MDKSFILKDYTENMPRFHLYLFQAKRQQHFHISSNPRVREKRGNVLHVRERRALPAVSRIATAHGADQRHSGRGAFCPVLQLSSGQELPGNAQPRAAEEDEESVRGGAHSPAS